MRGHPVISYTACFYVCLLLKLSACNLLDFIVSFYPVYNEIVSFEMFVDVFYDQGN